MGLKPKILIFIDWFLPGYKAGGPIKSVANIVRSFQDEIDFSIVTSNTDFGENEPYAGIQPNSWIQQVGYRILYLEARQQKYATIKRLMQEEEYSYLYLNSLFSLKFTLFPLLAHKYSKLSSKIILAPRGMLGQGALNLKKQKKRMFLGVSRLLGLYEDISWHASTKLEAAEVHAAFGDNVNVKVATNIASLASVQGSERIKTSQSTSFFFLSRISPKKNLLGALQLLAEISVRNSISFHIIGPVEDEGYWQQCQALIRKLPEHIQVNYMGAVPNPELPAILQNFHFLLLPTFSENYGHVVVESWSSGCPVILSNQTPWRGLANEKVGWDLPLEDKAAFVDVLERCITMGNEEFQEMRLQTQAFLKREVITEEILDQNRKLFSLEK